MIVKNESAVILRALRSAKPLIQYWVIVDTGSVDDTPQLIRDFLKEIPGELHERPWVDFAHNRNEALALAKGKADYLLFLDAGDELVLESGFCMPPLNKDFYLVSYRESVDGFVDAAYAVFLIDNRLSWRWEGVLHEHLVCSEAKTHEAVPCIYNAIRHDGGRSQDPEKLDKDIAILKAALEREPDQSRYVYFLAESAFCKRDFQGAREAYERRTKMGGYHEEIYRSFHYLGKCNYLLQNHEEALHSYCRAYQCDPERIEPLYDLSWIFFNEGQPLLSYLVARFGAAQIGRLKPQLRSQPWIVDGGFEELLAKSRESLSKKWPFLP